MQFRYMYMYIYLCVLQWKLCQQVSVHSVGKDGMSIYVRYPSYAC